MLRAYGNIDLVIGHKLDRLARNLADPVEITRAIRNAGAELVSVTRRSTTRRSASTCRRFAANAPLYSATLSTEVMLTA